MIRGHVILIGRRKSMETHQNVSCSKSVGSGLQDCVWLLKNFSHSGGQDSVVDSQHGNTVCSPSFGTSLVCIVCSFRVGWRDRVWKEKRHEIHGVSTPVSTFSNLHVNFLTPKSHQHELLLTFLPGPAITFSSAPLFAEGSPETWGSVTLTCSPTCEYNSSHMCPFKKQICLKRLVYVIQLDISLFNPYLRICLLVLDREEVGKRERGRETSM